MHVVREGRQGDGGSPHHKSKGGKKSNWHKDLDEKGVKHAKPISGGHKGVEKKVKKGAY